jgi:uroporphyrinogen III methyltransferase/synthase
MRNKTGRVYLIGAGPGDPGLISVKGKELLRQCDVVVYDALVNEMLIALLPSRIRRIYAGKRGGGRSIPQAAINRLLAREALKGKMVARLKGGDPLVLGRGGEEMEYLRARRIPFEIVPGISSALAAPACAGIPITHRGIARSAAVATGHLQAGEPIENLELPVADILIFLMAMENISFLVKKLVSSGKFTRATPAALVRNATLPDQQVVSGTLGTIEKLKLRRRIIPPAVFIAGEAAGLARTLKWFRKPPLAGIRAVVARTPEQSDELIEALYKKGATVVPMPLIKIRPRTLAGIGPRFLKPFSMVIFTSPNGVRIFMDSLLRNAADARLFGGKKIYAIGASTAQALRGYGILADGVPAKFVAEGVLDMLPARLDNEKVLIPRASKARETLPRSLAARGASVTVLPVYDTVMNTIEHCPVHDGDYVLFTSSSIADIFFRHPHCRQRAVIPCCIGEITAATVRKYYKGESAVAVNATIPAMITALERMVKTKRRQTEKTP